MKTEAYTEAQWARVTYYAIENCHANWTDTPQLRTTLNQKLKDKPHLGKPCSDLVFAHATATAAYHRSKTT